MDTAAAKPATIESLFGMPKFEMPAFDVSKMQVPEVYREMAEKGIAQAKDTYDKIKVAAEDATETLKDSYTTAAKGVTNYNVKVIEVSRTNVSAAFDFAQKLLNVKSLSEFTELSTTHAHKQFEVWTEQAKVLTALTQQVTTDTVEPIRTGVTKALKKAA
jgi:phasin